MQRNISLRGARNKEHRNWKAKNAGRNAIARPSKGTKELKKIMNEIEQLPEADRLALYAVLFGQILGVY